MKDADCPRCGAPLKTYMRRHLVPVLDAGGEKIGSAWGDPVPTTELCECVKAGRRAEEAEERRKERQAAIDGIIRSGNIEERFAGASFEAWKPSPETENFRAACLGCAQAVCRGEKDAGLILLGGVGNGKSTAAACICKYVAAQFKTFKFVNVPALLDMMRNTFDENSRERLGEIMNALCECDLLALDDLGAEKCTDWTEERLYLVINERYAKCRNVVVTTNAVKMKRQPGEKPEAVRALADMISERIYDRLLEMCSWAENGAGSFRRMKAKERMTGR